MKKLSNILIYLFVGIVSFVFFLYLSFPYNVLKETLAYEIANATGLSVTIKNMGPQPLIGLTAEGISLGSRSGKDLELRKVSVGVSVFSLLMLKVKANVEVVDATDGRLDMEVGFGLFDLIGGTAFPSSLVMNAEKLSFGSFVELALRMQAASPTTSVLLKPVLEKISVAGKLSSKVDFSFDTSDFSRSKGTLSINMTDTSIDFDPTMAIPSQKFESAVIKASSQGGSLTFDPSSRFKSKGMDIALTGKIIEKTKVEQSILDVQVNMQFFQELKSQFGFVLNAIAGKETDGKLLVKVSGPLVPSPEVKIL